MVLPGNELQFVRTFELSKFRFRASQELQCRNANSFRLAENYLCPFIVPVEYRFKAGQRRYAHFCTFFAQYPFCRSPPPRLPALCFTNGGGTEEPGPVGGPYPGDGGCLRGVGPAPWLLGRLREKKNLHPPPPDPKKTEFVF